MAVFWGYGHTDWVVYTQFACEAPHCAESRNSRRQAVGCRELTFVLLHQDL